MNAGFEPDPIVCEAHRRRADGFDQRVFDVVQREWVDPWSGGIVDSVAVALTVLETSVSIATIALSADVLVRRKNPPLAGNP